MAVVKVVELIGESEKSWEDATNQVLLEASKTIRGIQTIYIKNFQAIVDGNRITGYRVNAKVSFIIDDVSRG